MIKKYGSGILAIIVAIAAFAFTKPVTHIPLSTKIFQYQAPALHPFSQTNVEDRSNWVITNLSSTTCNQSNQKACQLLVNPSDINPDNTLSPTFTIQSTMSSSDVYYVSGGSAAAVYNKN